MTRHEIDKDEFDAAVASAFKDHGPDGDGVLIRRQPDGSLLCFPEAFADFIWSRLTLRVSLALNERSENIGKKGGA